MTEIAVSNLDLRMIADSGQCFRWFWDGEGFRIPAFGMVLHARQDYQNKGLLLDCSPEDFERYWKDYFDLGTDYGAVIRFIPPEDAFLQEAARFGSGIRILRQDPWEVLVTFLLSQRKSIPAIRQSVEKLCSAAGTRIATEKGEEIFAFPSPEQLAALGWEKLTACGLGYRAKYVERTAHAFCEGGLSSEKLEALPDPELYNVLCGLYGVGKKVAQCSMLFGFHRLNAFPVDVWMNRVAERHYPGGIPAERYAPWAGIMQQYLFYYERHLANAWRIPGEPMGQKNYSDSRGSGQPAGPGCMTGTASRDI